MTTRLEAVYLPNRPPESLWDVTIEDGTIISIKPSSTSTPSTTNASDPQAHPLLLPTLCHPHIHLDKPYLLCSSHPRYSDLIPIGGTFSEALANTSRAKSRYDREDLLLRGSQLIIESVKCGVTSMRAFVEIDHVTNLTALEAGLELKHKFAQLCHVQIVAFAQDPILSTENGGQNLEMMTKALQMYGHLIDVVGTTPYVEASHYASIQNIDWAITMALKYKLHLDFHLDYNLDPHKKADVWEAISRLRLRDWNWETGGEKTIVLGHCTRMSIFSEQDMQLLASDIQSSKLPISFVGLPTSDLFMMGRPVEGSWGGQRPRGTLQVLDLIRRLGIDAAVGVNNVGNAFTPWGSVDPLRLASLGVGIYQAGTEKDAETLFGCVSWRARAAIGILGKRETEVIEEGLSGEWMLIKNRAEEVVVLGGGQEEIRIPARQWRTMRDVVWDPPEVSMREILR